MLVLTLIFDEAIAFLIAPENIPFAISISLMVFIALMEGVALLVGFSFSEALAALLPDVDMHGHFDLGGHDSFFTDALGWLKIGKVPMLMLLVIFLTSFGAIGYTIQYGLVSTAGALMSPLIVSVASFFPSLLAVRVLGGALEKALPKDETYAISIDDLVGRVATISIGTAKIGKPARGKVTDQFGHWHNIMVEPDGDYEFPQGAEALLVSRDKNGVVFKGVPNMYENLKDKD